MKRSISLKKLWELYNIWENVLSETIKAHYLYFPAFVWEQLKKQLKTLKQELNYFSRGK